MVNEFRQAIRTHCRNWRSVLGIVAMMSLGVGAASGSLTVMRTALANPLGITDPAEVLTIDGALLSLGDNEKPGQDLLDYKPYLKAFADLAAFSDHRGGVNLGTPGTCERVDGAEVTVNFFSTFKLNPIVGRGFTAEEAQPGRNRVVVVSEAMWRTILGGSPSIVGQTVRLNAVPFTVIGVAPAHFRFPNEAQFWIPISFAADRVFTGPFIGYTVFGRLRRGVSRGQADSNLQAFVDAMRSERPASWAAHRPMHLVELRDTVVAELRVSLIVLTVATGLIWLATAANAANAVLGQSLGRMRQAAIRMALGASPRQIAAHSCAEAAVLMTATALAGLGVATLTVTLTRAHLPGTNPGWLVAGALASSYGMVLVLSAITGLICAVPALLQLRTHAIVKCLRSPGGATGVPGVLGRVPRGLVVCQVAAALVLAVGTSGLARTLREMQSVDPGFRTTNRLVVSVAAPRARYASLPSGWSLYDALIQRLSVLPGVERVGATNAVPLGRGEVIAVLVETQTAPKHLVFAVDLSVTPGYLSAMGMTVIEGRLFREHDAETGARVAIVSETMARRLWGKEHALGRQMQIAGVDAPVQVVGVVRDVAQFDLRSKREAQIYRPYRQTQHFPGTLVIQSASDPSTLRPAVQRLVQSLDPDLAAFGIDTLDRLVERATARERAIGVAMGLFGLVALILAAVSVYTTTTAVVARRKVEIGIRTAVGASPASVVAWTMSHALRLVSIGLLAGMALTWALMTYMRSMLVNVRITELMAYLTGTAVLAVIAAAASYLAGRRAANAEVVLALRSE